MKKETKELAESLLVERLKHAVLLEQASMRLLRRLARKGWQEDDSKQWDRLVADAKMMPSKDLLSLLKDCGDTELAAFEGFE